MGKFIVVHSVKVATDFTPETFGRLTSIGPKFLLSYGRKRKHRAYGVYQCSCGNVCVTHESHVKRGVIKSCGCLNAESTGNRRRTHGMAQTAEYKLYNGVKTRCYNINAKTYSDYGGRGITVCDRWLEPNGQGFLNFLADMGPRPSPKHEIERKHNDGNYCPENCCWATRDKQSRNKRNNVNLTHNGKTQCITDWAKELGMKLGTLQSRLRSGWSVEKALTVPVRRIHD